MKSLIKNKIQGKNGLGWVTMAQGLVFGWENDWKDRKNLISNNPAEVALNGPRCRFRVSPSYSVPDSNLAFQQLSTGLKAKYAMLLYFSLSRSSGGVLTVFKCLVEQVEDA
ncbi:hypothetical protein RRG08_037624 [Elysia crispata]|uniref:Uncharacterized protein n=1 Tax=Elysia crispata TaxID=231223 RepID=A0AAE1CZ08_9GAST|nr:hypothetical protein RRG08_037624 [Elysia crispata]